jgi:SAM-dependent methyltransferase
MRFPTPLHVARYIRRQLRVVNAASYLARYGIDVVYLAGYARWRNEHVRERCPACGFEGPFVAFGNPPRLGAQCPGCGSLERHRFLALLLDQGLIPEGSDILHFAPEARVGSLLRRVAKRYVTADLYMQGVALKLNIEETGLADEEFDVVVCSHVLDYVDDRKALSELRRIIRPGGLLILMVEVTEGIPTYEDSTLNADQRESVFGDRAKLRLYGGADFRDLIRNSGFELKTYVAETRPAIENGLDLGDKIFVCSR